MCVRVCICVCACVCASTYTLHSPTIASHVSRVDALGPHKLQPIITGTVMRG